MGQQTYHRVLSSRPEAGFHNTSEMSVVNQSESTPAQIEVNQQHAKEKFVRVTSADDMLVERHEISRVARSIGEMAQQAHLPEEAINAKRDEIKHLFTRAISDADNIPIERIKKRLFDLAPQIEAAAGPNFSREDRDKLLLSDAKEVPSKRAVLYNLLQEEYALNAARTAPSMLRALYAREALAGHTDSLAPLAKPANTASSPSILGIGALSPSAGEITQARQLMAEAARLDPEVGQVRSIDELATRANHLFGDLLRQAQPDVNSDHALAAHNDLWQATRLANKDTTQANHLFQSANAQADQINYAQIQKELESGSLNEQRRQLLQNILLTSKEARLAYAYNLVQEGRPNEAKVYLTRASVDTPELARQDPTFDKTRAAASAQSASDDVIKKEQALTLNLGTSLNDPKAAAQLLPKVLSTLTLQTTDLAAAQKDIANELQSANAKLKTTSLNDVDKERLQNQVKEWQRQEVALRTDLDQRKQELANTQYKAALLALACQDTKTARTMLTGAKENDPQLFDWIKQQGGKGEETYNRLLEQSQEKSFWQKNWHWITEGGSIVGGALAVGAAVAFAPVTAVGAAVVGGAALGTIAASSAAMYYAKKSTGENATWRDAVEGGFNGGLSSLGAAAPLYGALIKSVPWIGEAAGAVAQAVPQAVSKVASLAPEGLKAAATQSIEYGKAVASEAAELSRPVVSRVAERVRPFYDEAAAGRVAESIVGAGAFRHTPDALRKTLEPLFVRAVTRAVPSPTSWALGATYGSYHFHRRLADGDSFGHAALMFVPSVVRGTMLANGVTKGLANTGSWLSRKNYTQSGEYLSSLAETLPRSLLPTNKLALGVGVSYASVKAGAEIANGKSLPKATWEAPFDVLEGAQGGRLIMNAGQFAKEATPLADLPKMLAVTAGSATALGYGYSGVKHASLYGIGQESGREALGNFLSQGPAGIMNMNFYQMGVKAGLEKVDQQLEREGAQAASDGQVLNGTQVGTHFAQSNRYAWVGARGLAYSAVPAIGTAGVVSTYNSIGDRIPGTGIRPNNNPDVPLDVNRANELTVVKRNMSQTAFADLDTPR